MAEERENPRIQELELLRAPQRTDQARRAARDRIRAAAAPLLARRRRPATSWDVLAAWARPGLVAASVAALLILGGLQVRRLTQPRATPTASEVLAAGERGQLPTLLVARNEPDADALIAAALLNGNGTAPQPPAAQRQR